jgi:TetR/AcrR family fatty acid metabolism transcriptional regulator
MNHHSPRPSPGRHGKNGKSAAAKKRAGAASLPEKGGDKRARILDAAERVFAKAGFYNAKVSAIAEAAGVADGTIYLYFKSKDELLINLFEERMERINDSLRQALALEQSGVKRIERVIHMHLDLAAERRHLAEVICLELRQSAKFIKEYANPKFAEFLRVLADAIADGQKTGELRADVDAHIVSRALFGALDELSLQWLVKGKPELAELKNQVTHLFVDGLRARPKEQ